jgi:SAM-dependent methyltransferase
LSAPAPALPHGHDLPPSPWVLRFAHLPRPGGQVLDLAAGMGRHAALFAAAGMKVEAVDRDPAALEALRRINGVKVIEADLEAGAPWPFAAHRFDAVVVTNYLWRALFPRIAGSLAPGGVLIYETFGIGNERHGRPSNPDFLLKSGELLEFARDAGLEVVAYERGLVNVPKAAVIERICARRAPAAPARLDASRPDAP